LHKRGCSGRCEWEVNALQMGRHREDAALELSNKAIRKLAQGHYYAKIIIRR